MLLRKFFIRVLIVITIRVLLIGLVKIESHVTITGMHISYMSLVTLHPSWTHALRPESNADVIISQAEYDIHSSYWGLLACMGATVCVEIIDSSS